MTGQSRLPPRPSGLLTNPDAVLSRTWEAQSPMRPGALASGAADLPANAQTGQATVGASHVGRLLSAGSAEPNPPF